MRARTSAQNAGSAGVNQLVAVRTIRGGSIVSSRFYWDYADVLRQLGLS